LASPPGQWWLLVEYLHAAVEGQFDWVLINYKGERMYVGPNSSEAIVWKGRDSLRMATWVRWRSLEAIKCF
jgi:hypothetical protein